jgi:hypothetical protein
VVEEVSDQVGCFAEVESGIIRSYVMENGIAGTTTGNSLRGLVAITGVVIGKGGGVVFVFSVAVGRARGRWSFVSITCFTSLSIAVSIAKRVWSSLSSPFLQKRSSRYLPIFICPENRFSFLESQQKHERPVS